MEKKKSVVVGNAVRNLVILAGPNGCGKSTLASKLGIDYISPDIYEKEQYPEITDKVQKERVSSLSAAKIMYDSILEGKSCSVETTFGSGRIPKLFLAAKEKKGYKLILYYIAADSCDICINRVAKRVSEGGHNVPADLIKSRYEKSLTVLPKLLTVVDEAMVYDSSKCLYPFLRKENGKIRIISTVPNWAQYLIKSVEQKGDASCQNEKDML